jgi:N-acetylneuraminate lyase
MVYPREEFKGIIPAMPACYNSNGEISLSSLRRLTKELITQGVDGLYVGGSTGEGFLQTSTERKQVIQTVVEEAAGRIPVIAQVGSLSTAESVQLAQHAESVGADAISAVPPFYYAVSEAAVADHWLAITNATSLPFIMYHIPSATGFHLTGALLARMIAHPQVAGVKVSSSSPFELQQFKRIGGKGFLVFNGPDEQYLAGRVMGADAGIGGTYAAMSELYIAIEQAYASGHLAAAQGLQETVSNIIADMLKYPIHAVIKELIKLKGIDCGPPRRPLEPVADEHRPAVLALFKRIQSAIEGIGLQ